MIERRRRSIHMLKSSLKHLAVLVFCLAVAAAALAFQPGTAKATGGGPIVPMSTMQSKVP